MVTISVLEDVENVFDLNVIPTTKYPLDAEGMIVWCFGYLATVHSTKRLAVYLEIGWTYPIFFAVQ